MTTSAAAHLQDASYNKLGPPKTWYFKFIEVSPTTITIGKDGIPKTTSVDQATLVPSAKWAV